MNKITKLRIIIKLRGLFLAIITFVFPSFFLGMLLILISGINNSFYLRIKEDLVFLQVANFILFLIILFLLIKFLKWKIIPLKKEKLIISFKKAVKPAFFSFFISFLIIFAVGFILKLIPCADKILEFYQKPNAGIDEIINFIKSSNYFEIISLAVYIIFLAPIYEEIIFRGFLQDSIEKIVKIKYLDIIIVALPFSALHLPSLANTLFAFILGIFLSMNRKKFKSINTTVIMHSIINFIGLLLGVGSYFLSQ